jgi:hypothetical protein
MVNSSININIHLSSKQRWSTVPSISTFTSHLNLLNTKKDHNIQHWESMSWLGTVIKMWRGYHGYWEPNPHLLITGSLMTRHLFHVQWFDARCSCSFCGEIIDHQCLTFLVMFLLQLDHYKWHLWCSLQQIMFPFWQRQLYWKYPTAGARTKILRVFAMYCVHCLVFYLFAFLLFFCFLHLDITYLL